MRRLLIIFILLLATSAVFAQEEQLSPYAIALARIEEAAQTDATRLDLSDLSLSHNTLPAEIGELEHIQELILSGNQFDSVPPELARLTDLVHLYMPNNHLNNLSGISNLSQLRILVLDRNELSELPTELFTLRSLNYLSVAYNQLTHLPSEIAQLSNLRELHADHNLLTTIPVELTQIQWLNTINFSYNQIRYLPSEIGYLNLSEENEHQPFIDGNPLTDPSQAVIDEGMSAVLAYLRNQADEQLSPYDIALARIEEAAASEATTLDLSDLGLTVLPPEIGQLTNLQALYIGNNELTSLPPEIGKLTQLTVLHAMDNALTSLPSEIGNLRNLCVAELGSNQLTSLPYELLIEMESQFNGPNCYLFVLQNPLFPTDIEMTSSSEAWLDQLREQTKRDHDLREATLTIVRLVALIGALVLVARRLRGPQKKRKVA